MNSDLIKEKLKNLNLSYQHPSYFLEKKLLTEIKMGMINESIQTLKEINSSERAVLAKIPLRSIKNSLISSCTLFTRAVLEIGINSEDAFALSDVFINQIELFDDVKALSDYEFKMLEEFIKLGQKKQMINFSHPVRQIIRYINENITKKITLSDLSKLTSKSPDYLSKLFKKEVGINLTNYIHQQKIEAAKYFLEYTTMEITEIATLFLFSNPAHFSKVFKQHVGLSPSQHRRA